MARRRARARPAVDARVGPGLGSSQDHPSACGSDKLRSCRLRRAGGCSGNRPSRRPSRPTITCFAAADLLEYALPGNRRGFERKAACLGGLDRRGARCGAQQTTPVIPARRDLREERRILQVQALGRFQCHALQLQAEHASLRRRAEAAIPLGVRRSLHSLVSSARPSRVRRQCSPKSGNSSGPLGRPCRSRKDGLAMRIRRAVPSDRATRPAASSIWRAARSAMSKRSSIKLTV
jgi:hypothetical protein